MQIFGHTRPAGLMGFVVLVVCLVPQMESAEVGLSASPPVKVQVSEGEKNARWERRERNGSRRAWEEEDLPVFCEYAAPSFGKGQLVFVRQ